MEKIKNIVIAILLLVILGGFIYFIFDKRSNSLSDNSAIEKSNLEIDSDSYVGMGVSIKYPSDYVIEENRYGADFIDKNDEAQFGFYTEDIESSCTNLLCEIENYKEENINDIDWKIIENAYCYMGGCYDERQDVGGVEITDTTYYVAEENGIRYVLYFWDESEEDVVRYVISNFSI